MTGAGARRSARPRWERWLGCAAVLAFVTAWLHLVMATYLWAFSSEGSLPPRWRVPDVPDGAVVVREGEACASGGCWREVVVDPADGDTPADLAAAMGLTPDEQYGFVSRDRQGWRFLDPAPVAIHSEASGGLLVVIVQYVHSAA
ncbi:MAG TPA: hypothetical protein VGE77_01145 [Nocardioides sp.]